MTTPIFLTEIQKASFGEHEVKKGTVWRCHCVSVIDGTSISSQTVHWVKLYNEELWVYTTRRDQSNIGAPWRFSVKIEAGKYWPNKLLGGPSED